ncbi:MAG: histidinol dehydrogenase [Acetivibrionales bacterium]|jgi:histidinol dehydrogenase
MMRIIDARQEDSKELFKKLVSRSRFEPEEITSSVNDIVENVRAMGDKALIEFTRRFDGIKLEPEEIKVSKEETDNAYKAVDTNLIGVIRRAKENIERFHLKQKENSWFSTEADGVILGQLYRPLEMVGVYVPGGTAPLPSSVLMNVIPAKVAGVQKIVMATPPRKNGKIDPSILVAANEAGVDEIYRIGGAQAIAAMAFGTDTVQAVDKIVGPGNIFVATAKRMVYGYCDIDMVAGPSEIMVVADESADPRFVAADLLSQAEHDVLASSILVTSSGLLADQVNREVNRQISYLDRKDILIKSIEEYGAIVIVKSIEEAVDFANRVAPEHLELCVEDPFSILSRVKNAGAIFLGNYSSEPLGDYYAGPNHVLPTNGTARFFSSLNVGDFIKKSSVISYTEKALRKAKDDIIRFAEAEGLAAHANAIKIRFQKE